MIVYGYVCVSTCERELTLLGVALSAAGCVNVRYENVSGASRRGREELERCRFNSSCSSSENLPQLVSVVVALFWLRIWRHALNSVTDSNCRHISEMSYVEIYKWISPGLTVRCFQFRRQNIRSRRRLRLDLS
jgi:hypothetical protein